MDLVDISQRHLLSPIEQRMLDFILQSIEQDDPKINIRGVANACYVSTTTVIKLAKKLGYDGYSDMLYSLRRHGRGKADSAAGIDLTSILEEVDQKQLEQFSDTLYRHREQTIFIVGLGFSTVSSAYFMRRLAILGIRAYDGSPMDMLRRKQEPGIVLVLSRSGETQDLLDIAERAAVLGYEIVAITARRESTLARMAQSTFVIKTGNVPAYDVPDFYVGRSIILFEYILSKLVARMRSGTPDELPV